MSTSPLGTREELFPCPLCGAQLATIQACLEDPNGGPSMQRVNCPECKVYRIADDFVHQLGGNTELAKLAPFVAAVSGRMAGIGEQLRIESREQFLLIAAEELGAGLSGME